jgi:flagellar hook-length control protein FliK
MSIESSTTSHSARVAVGHDHRASKKSAQTPATPGNDAGGFSALMGMLTTVDTPVDANLTENSATLLPDGANLTAMATVLQPMTLHDGMASNLAPAGLGLANQSVDGINSDKNVPVVLSDKGFVAMNSIANMPLSAVAQMPPEGISILGEQTTDTLVGIAPAAINSEVLSHALASAVDVHTATTNSEVPSPALASSVGVQVATTSTPSASMQTALPGQPAAPAAAQEGRYRASQPTAAAATGSAGRMGQEVVQATLDPVARTSASDPSVQAQIDTLLGHRSVSRPTASSSVQVQSQEFKSQTIPSPMPTDPEAVAAQAMSGLADAMVRTQEKPGNKASGTQGGTGFEGLFGSSTVGLAGRDASYEVAAASATVPDSAIAETVSYWVTHGIQNAELTLDGFGGDPVEVSISLNGDQAQIDFRTNQTDVRQLLESATADLKELLAGEGLQLAGLSVGLTGGGSAQSGSQQQKPAARQAAIVASPAVTITASRSTNLTVGRTLDLFV